MSGHEVQTHRKRLLQTPTERLKHNESTTPANDTLCKEVSPEQHPVHRGKGEFFNHSVVLGASVCRTTDLAATLQANLNIHRCASRHARARPHKHASLN